jgi:hypothetical protein
MKSALIFYNSLAPNLHIAGTLGRETFHAVAGGNRSKTRTLKARATLVAASAR